MSDVKRYYVGINAKCLGGIGLVEMTDLYREATGFDGLVMGKDYDAIKAENEVLRKDARLLNILVEAMAEVKATSDGKSDQPIADIVSGCLAEIAAISSPENPY